MSLRLNETLRQGLDRAIRHERARCIAVIRRHLPCTCDAGSAPTDQHDTDCKRHVADNLANAITGAT